MGKLFARPYFVTPHAVGRFRERIADIPPAQVIEAVQSMLQEPGLPVDADVRDGKLVLVHRGVYRDKTVYMLIGREEGREWPIVITVLGVDSPLHQHVQARTSQWRKWEPKDTEVLLKLREAGFAQRQCMTIMRWSHSTIERRLKAAGVTCAKRRWTEREKEAMVRLRAMGKSYKEIAKRLKRTPGAIKVAMSRYRQKVKNDPDRRLALRILAFCSNPGRVLRAIRESGIYTELKQREMERRDMAL